MMVIPWLLGTAIDEVLANGLRSQLLLLAGSIILMGFITAVLSYGRTYLTDSVSQRVGSDLRNALFRKLQSLSFGFHDRQRTGDLMSTATSDVEEAYRFTGYGLINGLHIFVLLGVVSTLVLTSNLRLGLICMAFIPPVLWRSAMVIPPMVNIWTKTQAEMGRMTTVVQENLTGIRVVKAFGARKQATEKFERTASQVARLSYAAAKMHVSRTTLSVWISDVATAAILLFGAREVVSGRLTAGELAAFILYIRLLWTPTQHFGFLISTFTHAAAAGQRIFGVLDAESPVEEKAGAQHMSRAQGHIKLEKVSLSYGHGGEAIHGIDFEAQPGQLVALIGAPGSGKSTIAHLLPRFYDVSEGRITIDGNDVRDVTLDSLRQSVGIVLQDTFAFSATIRDNIAYGLDNAPIENIVRVAKLAQLHEFIDSLPDGYDTWVGERGITLSGGQRQRLAIARTILRDPPVLILDDSTSSVDVATEHRIQRALAEVIKGRTTFVIAHRLSTVRNADLILVLEQGEIVERGTHNQLLAQDGYYRRIYDLQLSPEQEDLTFRADSLPISQTADASRSAVQERPESSPSTTFEEDQVPGGLYDREVVMRLLTYLRPYRRRVVLALAALLIYAGAIASLPWIVKLAIDGYISTGERDLSGLNILALVYVLVGLVEYISSYAQQTIMAYLGERVRYALRMDMFNHLQRLSMAFFDRNQVGRLMSRLQNDVQQLQQFFSIFTLILPKLLTGIFIISAMFAINVRLALVSLAVVSLLFPIINVWHRYARTAFLEVRRAIADVNSRLQEDLSGIRVVQSLNRQRVSIRRFQRANFENLEANLKASRYSAILPPSVETLTALGLALVVIVGGSMVLGGSLEVGVLLAFALYILRFFKNVGGWTLGYGEVQKGMISGGRIFELLDVEPDVKDKPGAVHIPTIRGDLRYEGVSFHYTPGIPVLRGINLEIGSGETVALVGPTGAGKTTIASLLLRYYDATEGRITVDGHDIRDISQDSLAQQMGVVLQEPFLFSGTVKENIRYNRSKATDEEIVKVAKAVGANEFITRLEQGYDTAILERGINLSVGQRQLVSFARALVADPRILILDEATANVDTESEMLIQEALNELLRDRTAIVIAHRLSTVRNADRIVVLDQGRIVEQGNHDQLMAFGGLYARLQSYTVAASAVQPQESGA